MGRSRDVWAFDPGFDARRQKTLEAVESFQSVADRIVAEIENIRVRVRLGTDAGLEDCRRPDFTFDVAAETFDAFFNSPNGYRGKYLFDPNVGDAVNRYLAHRLEHKLLAAGMACRGPHEMEEADLRASLQGASAKVWIDECFFPFQNPSRDLAVATWVTAANLGAKEAIWGLCAPTGTRLQVKGAFIDRWGNEVVPRGKIGRRFSIHNCGFS